MTSKLKNSCQTTLNCPLQLSPSRACRGERLSEKRKENMESDESKCQHGKRGRGVGLGRAVLWGACMVIEGLRVFFQNFRMSSTFELQPFCPQINLNNS